MRIPFLFGVAPVRRMVALLAAAVLAVVVAPGTAFALTCDPTDNDRIEASRVISNIRGRLAVMEKSIVEALRLQTGQLSGYQAKSAKVVTEGLDAQTRLQAQIAREVEETRAMRARRPARRACRTITGLSGLGSARTAAMRARERAGSAETGRIANDRRVVRGGSVAGNSDRFKFVTTKYCNAARQGEDDKVCPGAEAMHAADLQPGNLFDRRTISGEDELRIAIELSRNLAVPVVHDPVPVGSSDTSEERRRLLLGRSADARVALAADYFAHIRSLRAEGADLGAWAAAIVPGRASGQAVSRYELLEILASRRFERPEWFTDLQAMSSENLLRELVTLQAVSSVLAWERFRLEERRGAVDAARLAIAAEEARVRSGLDKPAAAVN